MSLWPRSGTKTNRLSVAPDASYAARPSAGGMSERLPLAPSVAAVVDDGEAGACPGERSRRAVVVGDDFAIPVEQHDRRDGVWRVVDARVQPDVRRDVRTRGA